MLLMIEQLQLFNGALKSIGVIKEGETRDVVDKSKIVRGKVLYQAIEMKRKRTG